MRYTNPRTHSLTQLLCSVYLTFTFTLTDCRVDGAAEIQRAREGPSGRLGARPQRLARVAVLHHQRVDVT